MSRCLTLFKARHGVFVVGKYQSWDQVIMFEGHKKVSGPKSRSRGLHCGKDSRGWVRQESCIDRTWQPMCKHIEFFKFSYINIHCDWRYELWWTYTLNLPEAAFSLFFNFLSYNIEFLLWWEHTLCLVRKTSPPSLSQRWLLLKPDNPLSQTSAQEVLSSTQTSYFSNLLATISDTRLSKTTLWIRSF